MFSKDYGTRNYDSIRKLSEGLNLIEQQYDEKFKKLEQVISAEIKLRKNNEKNMNEKLENYNEKFTFAMQSFQSTLGSLGTRLSEQREMVNTYSVSSHAPLFTFKNINLTQSTREATKIIYVFCQCLIL